jgi:hypothetical protein
MFKINFDAAIQDHFSANYGEAFTGLMAAQLARFMNLTFFIMESDYLMLILALKQPPLEYL